MKKALRRLDISQEGLDIIGEAGRTTGEGQHNNQPQCADGGGKNHKVNGDCAIFILKKI